MDRQPFSVTREIIVANAIQDVASELRLIELADYIAFIRLESMANIADIVESAAELFFMPGTLLLRHGCEAHVTWTDSPRIALDLELRPEGATIYFTLSLTAFKAGVEVNYVAFQNPSDDPELNSAFLKETLENARIRKSFPSSRSA
ncbi:hypothetical protein [Nitratireductor luteus]|uniref:hypothetical protein n=1 Tax=Nitratireductor luteus TaxID=2976980 RepID=UPI00223F7037|nr:hypothetical protein [Nitratireductor luteus]